MIRIVVFEGQSLLHAQFYSMCFTAQIGRGGDGLKPAHQQPAVPRDEQVKDKRTLRALKSVGVPQGELPEWKAGEPPPLDVRYWALAPEGGTLRLSQSDHTRLIAHVTNYPFGGALAEMQVELVDWLEAAPKEVEVPK